MTSISSRYTKMKSLIPARRWVDVRCISCGEDYKEEVDKTVKLGDDIEGESSCDCGCLMVRVCKDGDQELENPDEEEEGND
jgi:hypothetical protein